MKYLELAQCALLAVVSSCKPQPAHQEIFVNVAEKGAQVSETLYGVFIEDINRCGDGGLYAEMILNRSFEDQVVPEGYTVEGDKLLSPVTYNHVTGQQVQVQNRWCEESVPGCEETIPGWRLHATDDQHARMTIADKNPCFKTAPHYLRLSVDAGAGEVHLFNSGYGGMHFNAGENYRLRVIARGEGSVIGQPLQAVMLDASGDILASAELKISAKWHDETLLLTPKTTTSETLLLTPKTTTSETLLLTPKTTTSDARFELRLPANTSGSLCLDYVSLMPEHTFCNRPNGMRRDVAEAIVRMHPAFVRWPGGCVVEGITLNTRFQWKKAMGDPAARPGIYNLWGYRNSCGVGWAEMLQFCEDIGAKAMYVCNVGMACQAQTSELSAEKEIQGYIDDCMDAIEYALGDSTTPWGRRRAADGHPAPYPLQYVELGNENWGKEYDKRYNRFYSAIKERWPDLTLISNYALDGTGTAETVEMVDPHFYVAPNFFYNNTALLDTLARDKYKVYVGEYAVNRSVGSGNMNAALAEASWLTGIERNADLVTMTSYAPLLESSWYRAWPTNLIWVSPSQVVGRSSYWVQCMMEQHRATYNVKQSVYASQPEPLQYREGRIGLGTYKSKVEFKELSVTLPDGTQLHPDLAQGTSYVGEWGTTAEGVLQQTATIPQCMYLLDTQPLGKEYTLRLKGRKVAGKDAFLVFFGMDEAGQEGYEHSVGGQNNSKACVEVIHRGENSGQDGPICDFHAEMGQWYDLRIEVHPDSSLLYVDNRLMYVHKPCTAVLHAYAAGVDEARGELILKAVNASDRPYIVRYHLAGVKGVEERGTVTLLSAPGPDAENSFGQPGLITPSVYEFDGFAPEFDYELPPCSFAVFRVKLL